MMRGEGEDASSEGGQNDPLPMTMTSSSSSSRMPPISPAFAGLIGLNSSDAGVLKKKMQAIESLDYGLVDNALYRRHQSMQTFWDSTLRVLGKWVVCVVIALLVGLIAFIIKWSVEILADIKFDTLNIIIEKSGPPFLSVLPVFVTYCIISMTYAVVAAAPVLLFGGAAGGSGISEVMGYLNGVCVPDTITMRTFWGKVISIIFSFSSGLALGPEGPMIHIGSMIGGFMGQSTWGKSAIVRKWFGFFMQYRNDRDQRDFISSGAAAGVSAAFGAPVGGLLFSLEEASSFWSDKLTWRTFLCTMISAFTVNFCMKGFSTDITDTGLFRFGMSGDHLYHYLELLPFLLIAIVGGSLGAFFIHLNSRIARWRQINVQTTRQKLLEVMTVMLVTCFVNYSLSLVWPCSEESSINYVAGATNVQEPEIVRMYCKKGAYNQMASMLFTTPSVALRTFFSRTQATFGLAALFIYAIVYFFQIVVTAGLSLAAGLFVPPMLVGAAVGRFVGEMLYIGYNDIVKIDPSIYAMIGSIAVLTGFSRLSFSLVVIVVEITENTQYLLPIILCVMVAKWWGDLFGPSVYADSLKKKNIPYLPMDPHFVRPAISISKVMAKPVVTLHDIERVSTILEALASNQHNGFPIITNTLPPEKIKGRLRYNSIDYSLNSLPIMQDDNVMDILAANTESEDDMELGERGDNPHQQPFENSREEGTPPNSYCGFMLRKHLLYVVKHYLTNSFNNRSDDAAKDVRREGGGGEGEGERTPEDGMTSSGETQELSGRSSKEKTSKRLRRTLDTIDDEEIAILDAGEITYEEYFFESSFSETKLEDLEAMLDDEVKSMYIDIRPYMNMSAMSILDKWNLTQSYALFRTMGLRHLPVVNAKNRVVGMLTRKDFL